MKNLFSTFPQSLRTISYLILFGQVIYSSFIYIRTLDTNNIPEYTDRKQLYSDFLRVKVNNIKILPEVYENTATKKTILISYITSDKGLSFISPLPEDKIKENQFAQGSVLIFGKDDVTGSKIERKTGEIVKSLSRHPDIKSQDFLYLQGDKPDFVKSFQPAWGGLGLVAIVFYFTEKHYESQRIKKLQDESNKSKPESTSETIKIINYNK